MSKTRAPYAPEFRQQMIELVRSGRSPEELSREFEPSAQAIRNWVAQADRDEGRRAAVGREGAGQGDTALGTNAGHCGAGWAQRWHRLRAPWPRDQFPLSDHPGSSARLLR